MLGATAIYAAATTVMAVMRKGDPKVVLSTRAPKGEQKDAEAMDPIHSPGPRRSRVASGL